jgi:hypothetical protein
MLQLIFQDLIFLKLNCSFLLLAQKKRTKEKGSLKSFSKKDLYGIARLTAIWVRRFPYKNLSI